MISLIKKTPYPMAGLMLALAATGNLVMSYGEIFRNFFGVLSAILFLLLLTKIIMFPASLSEGFSNPVVASVIPTFSMGVMLLSTYLKPFLPTLSYYIWIGALILHIVLIMVFTVKYLFKLNIKTVFPSYFVVYVGIVVASVSAPAFDQVQLGQYIFWFGLTSYALLLPLISYRVFRVKAIPEPALPTLIIFAAPASLLLAGYLNSFTDKSMGMIIFLLALALLMLVFAFAKIPKLLNLQFYPSYSAFTFPFVISSIALKGTNNYFTNTDNAIFALGYLVKFMEAWSVLIVLYVLLRYTLYLVPVKVISPINTKNPVS